MGPDWALEHPQDYLDVFSHTIPAVLAETHVSPDDVIGVGVDFTACTVMPVKLDGTPLCFLEQFKSNPHAYVKLWKHHAAQDKANKLNEIAEARGEKWLSRYGGKISSEWVIPKIWQILDEAPEIYDAMDCFIEATDWVIWQLTGKKHVTAVRLAIRRFGINGTGIRLTTFLKRLIPVWNMLLTKS